MSVSDLANEALAHENLMLRDRIVELETDVDALRTTLSVAIDWMRHAQIRERGYRLRLKADTARSLRPAA